MDIIGDAARGSAGYVYFIRASNGLVKIGRSKNPRNRLIELRQLSPLPLTLLFAVATNNSSGLENRLHASFSIRHSHGEWFALTEADLERVKKDYGVAAAVKPVRGLNRINVATTVQERTPRVRGRPRKVL